MTLNHLNPYPRFAAAVAPLLSDPAEQLFFADIGARYGFPSWWNSLRPIAHGIGFEPAIDECVQLNANLQNDGEVNSRIYPFAIAGRTGRHRFYMTQLTDSAGLYRANPEWIERFPATTLNVKEEIEIDAMTLDDFCSKQSIPRLDFIKMDVEGAEFDVLMGAENLLSRPQGILGLQTEFWWDPIIKNQTGFAEIDLLLRKYNMKFFDIHLHRYPRSTLSSGRMQGKILPDGILEVDTIIDQNYGQAWTGDALYFRDPVGEMRANKLSPDWTAASLLRLCTLFDIYDYGDCAIEILEYFSDSLLRNINISPLIDALVPAVEGAVLDYETYRNISNHIRKTINETYMNITDWVPPPTKYRR